MFSLPCTGKKRSKNSLSHLPPAPIQFLLFPKENVNHDTKHFEGLYSFLPCYIPTLAGLSSYLHDILSLFFFFFISPSSLLFPLSSFLSLSLLKPLQFFRREPNNILIEWFFSFHILGHSLRKTVNDRVLQINFFCPNSFLVVYLVCNV